MELMDFDRQLGVCLAKLDNPRPFVCSGNPLKCDLFIVGFNAATVMKAQFWDFWCLDEGFDRDAWFDTYVRERAEMPLKKGKTRRLKISRTRRCIELITAELSPIPSLETNLYMSATTQASELEKRLMDPTTFNFLLSAIRPKLLLVHGKEAKLHLENLTKSTFALNRANKVTIQGVESIVYPISHLSRGWSNEHCVSLGAELKRLIATL